MYASAMLIQVVQWRRKAMGVWKYACQTHKISQALRGLQMYHGEARGAIVPVIEYDLNLATSDEVVEKVVYVQFMEVVYSAGNRVDELR